MSRSILVGFRVGVVTVLVAAAGCRARQENVQAMESNLRPLALFYGQFVGQHAGEPPASEEEFRAYLDSLTAADLAAWGESRSSAPATARQRGTSGRRLS